MNDLKRIVRENPTSKATAKKAKLTYIKTTVNRDISLLLHYLPERKEVRKKIRNRGYRWRQYLPNLNNRINMATNRVKEGIKVLRTLNEKEANRMNKAFKNAYELGENSNNNNSSSNNNSNSN